MGFCKSNQKSIPVVGFLTHNDCDVLRAKTGLYRWVTHRTIIPPTMDQNLEMRFTLRSSPLSGQNTTLGLQIPHRSGWPRKHRRLRLADPLRIWCWPNTTTSEMSSLRKPLMNSHHRRYGTMPLTSHLGLNSLAPGHSPCPLQNRRSLMTSSRRTLQMATSIHLSPPWEPLCSSSKRRMACFTSCRTIGS